ncbi:DUF948 domain-containing protein [Salininema proteolyticum]|uniref:DUF948 domain-containing protein n=1 Tax=Salininema proteolyticum TaxID=1607685 RepID=A0ABV8TZJ5_9ACTN
MSASQHAADFSNVDFWGLGFLILSLGIFIVLILLAVKILGKVGQSLDKTNSILDEVDHKIGPMLDNTNRTITLVNNNLGQTEKELAKVGAMTDNVTQVTSNVTNLTSLVTTALASPLVKAAAFAFGLKKTMKKQDDDYQEAQIRAALSAAEDARRDHKRKSRKKRK